MVGNGGVPSVPFNERQEFNALRAEARKIVKPLEPLGKLKVTQPDLLDKTDSWLRRLPAPEAFAESMDGLRTRAKRFVNSARQARRQQFGSIESAFLRRLDSEGTGVREVGSGWRVGILCMETKREQSKVRLLYNEEPVVSWSPVKDHEDLAQLVRKALASLEAFALPEPELVELVGRAYHQASLRQREQGRMNAGRVPALVFYLEFRIALVRWELGNQRPSKKLKYHEFPQWAFLYNVDRYLALGSKVPKEKRVYVETGSQKEAAQGMGIIINGLDPHRDYKLICYFVHG